MERQTLLESVFVPLDGSDPIQVQYIADSWHGKCIPISIKMPFTEHFEPIVYGDDYNDIIDVIIANNQWELMVDYGPGSIAKLHNCTGHMNVFYNEMPALY